MGTIIFGDPPAFGPGEGSPDDRIIGSGDAFPSFPPFVQYNGLLLNNWQAYDYFHINSIDGLDDADVRDNRQLNPNEDGETPYGTYYGGRTMVIDGQIRCYHLWKTDDMRDALKRAFRKSQIEWPLWIRLGGPDKDRIIYCKRNAKLEIDMTQPTSDRPWVPFMIPLRASNPRMLSYRLHTESASTGSGTQSGVDLFTITHDGDYDAEPVIRFYGPCTEMSLTRWYDTDGQTMIVGPIASGDYVEVDVSRKRVVDSAGNNAYSMYSDVSDFIRLWPEGPNAFEFSGSGLSSESSIVCSYRDSWV